VLVAFTRQVKNTNAPDFTNDITGELVQIMMARISSPEQQEYVSQKLTEIATQWQIKININQNVRFAKIPRRPQDPYLVSDMMNSLRDIEEDVYIENTDLRN